MNRNKNEKCVNITVRIIFHERKPVDALQTNFYPVLVYLRVNIEEIDIWARNLILGRIKEID